MKELNIEKFSPTVNELKMLVDTTKQIVVSDFKDKAQIKAVHDNRITLRDARNSIMKAGKAFRADALKFQKVVIAKERELIAIIEPEENRLAVLEDKAKQEKIKAERIALLPERKKKLAEIDPDGSHDDEVLLGMDAAEFQAYLNQKLTAKNQAKEDELNKKENDLKEKERALQQEKEAQEREEKARQDERERLEQEAKDKAEREEKEKAELAKREKFMTWLKAQGWTEGTKEDYLLQYFNGNKVIKLYKLVGTYLDDEQKNE